MSDAIYGGYAPIYLASGQAWVGLRSWSTLAGWLSGAGWRGQAAADLGCGSGEVAAVLAQAGYMVTAVDRSAAMVALARGRVGHPQITWQLADLADWQSQQSFDLVVSFYDTLNYLTDINTLASLAKRVGALLRPGGIFAFDLNTPNEYATWDERSTVTADSEDLFVYNMLNFSPESQLAEGRIVWFARTSAGWSRGEESHVQRAHSDDEVVGAIAGAGLRLQARLDPAGAPADPAAATRILYVAQRPDAQPT